MILRNQLSGKIPKLTDFGWPYTYVDGAKNLRLISPEYGGDGKTSPAPGTYPYAHVPLTSRRPRNGYNVVFVPFDRTGKAVADTRISLARGSTSVTRRFSRH